MQGTSFVRSEVGGFIASIFPVFYFALFSQGGFVLMYWSEKMCNRKCSLTVV